MTSNITPQASLHASSSPVIDITDSMSPTPIIDVDTLSSRDSDDDVLRSVISLSKQTAEDEALRREATRCEGMR